MPRRTLLLLTLAASGSAASNVVILTTTSFEAERAASDAGLFVKFYAPWCGHCKKLSPVWDALSLRDDLNGARVAKLDCTQHSEPRLKYAVSSFPTLLFFGPGIEYDAGGQAVLRLYRYSGRRDAEELAAFARGGWKEAEEYDPAAQPPPKPRKTIVQRLRENAMFLGCFIGALLALVATSLWCTRRSEAAEAARPAEATGAAQRTFGNVALAEQASPSPPKRPSTVEERTYGNVPLSQQGGVTQRKARAPKVD